MEVLVEYEYVAVEEDELTIHRGDIISNVVVLSDGWMEGDLDGRRGAFPDNFVKVVQELKKDDKSKEIKSTKESSIKKPGGGHVADLANKLGHQGIKMGPPPVSGAAKVTKRDLPRRRLRAQVAFSYTPLNDDELRLDAGDVVDILKQEEEGWWEGTLNGKTGMFPSNFVSLLDPGELDDKPPHPSPPGTNDKDGKKKYKGMGVGLGDIFKDGPINLRPTGEINKVERTEPKPVPPPTVPTEAERSAAISSKKNVTPKQPPALPPKDVTDNKKVDRARVLFSYVAENDDELSITEGDIISILEKELEDSGWWKGELNGKVGVFPDNFVDILPPEEVKPKKQLSPAVCKPAVPDPDRSIPRPTAPVADSKPKAATEEKKATVALPSKKPAMPPPPIGKKPVGPRQPDLIAQTDDHKVKESQKEAGLALAVRSLDVAPPSTGRMVGKLASTAPLLGSQNSLKSLPQPATTSTITNFITTTTTTSATTATGSSTATASTTEVIDLDIVPTAEPLTHPNASRVKAPPRRPPTLYNREEEKEEKEDPPPPGPAPPIPEFPDSPRRDAYARRSHRRAQQKADLQQKAELQQNKVMASCSDELLNSHPASGEEIEEPITRQAKARQASAAPPKSEPPPSPVRSPPPQEDSTEDQVLETQRLVANLQRELETLRATTVSQVQYEALQRDVSILRERTHKLEKLAAVLMNDIDEGAKERRSMQVEIDRIRKLSLLPGDPTL